MKSSLEFNFSHTCKGTIWNTLAMPDEAVLLLEVRDHQNRQTIFSALRYSNNTWLWQELKLDEPWWAGLAAAADGVVLFTIYLDTANPDKKGILAYALNDPKLLWWNNDFSLVSVADGHVSGLSSKYGIREVVLDLKSGKEMPAAELQQRESPKVAAKPVQYTEGTAHFDTVKTFLSQKLNLTPVAALEYLESEGLIFISYYVTEGDLVNYLLVLSVDGRVVLHEKLDEHLKGIGLDTFFILSGCVIFVRNKRELVSYQMI